MGYVFHCDATGTFGWFPRVRSHPWTSPPWPPAAGLEPTSLATSQFSNLRAERDPQLSPSLTNTVSSVKHNPLQPCRAQNPSEIYSNQLSRQGEHPLLATTVSSHSQLHSKMGTGIHLNFSSSKLYLFSLYFEVETLKSSWYTVGYSHTPRCSLWNWGTLQNPAIFPSWSNPSHYSRTILALLTLVSSWEGPDFPLSFLQSWCLPGYCIQLCKHSSNSTLDLMSSQHILPDSLSRPPHYPDPLLCTRLCSAHSILISKSELYNNFQITSKALSTTEATTSTCWALQLKPHIPKSVGQLCITCASTTTQCSVFPYAMSQCCAVYFIYIYQPKLSSRRMKSGLFDKIHIP